MLELKNIKFSVETDGEVKTIIKGVDLKIEKNKFIAITGPNGSGKSTLAKIIVGIEKPTSGEIWFNGENVTDLSVTDRAKRGMSFAFQAPVKFKGIEVLDLLRIASRKEISVAEACSYLSKVGLCAKDYINREVNGSLSGGELKRIEIATILARNTQLSVFDEPEAGIDLWSFQNLIEVFGDMRNSVEDGSIMIISHQERILDLADQIVVMNDGLVEKVGTKEEILPEILKNAGSVTGCPMTAKKEATKC